MKKLIITAVVILGFLLIGAYLLLSRPDQSQQTQQTGPTTTTATTDASEETILLTGLSQALELKPELRDYMYMDWISENNQILPLTGSQFIVGTFNITGIAKYNTIPKDASKITVKTLAPLLTTADAYFMNQGFAKNTVNTRTVQADQLQIAFTGYEKGPMKCVIRIDEESDPFGNFVCGTIDTQQQALQNEFRPLFTGTKANLDGIAITSFRVQKIEDNFALGSANGYILGYTWMAENKNGAWQIVWHGNEIALCSDMQKLGIPQPIYGNCYNGE